MSNFKEKLLCNGLTSAMRLWTIFFLYAIFSALIYQKIIVPNIPSLHAVGTTLTNDAVYYHQSAQILASEIRQHGWGHFKVFSATSSSAHVSILGAVYVLAGDNPMLAIPINAIFHALGGVLIFLIINELNGNKLVAKQAGFIAASIFVVFPSAVNWYGQISKDAYVIVGNLILVLVWLKVWSNNNSFKNLCFLFMLSLLGITLVAIMRPYALKILVLVLFILLSLMLITKYFPNTKSVYAFFGLTLLSLLLSLIIVSKEAGSGMVGDGYSKEVSAPEFAFRTGSNWQWERSTIFPSFIDTQFEAVAAARVSLSGYGLSVNAKSMIDADKMPSNIIELIIYWPRALQIALLSPFPNNWFQDFNIVKLIVSIEMALVYFCFIGLIFLFKQNFNYKILFILVFTFCFLSIYGVTITNVGTLYRLRYCYESLLLALGVLGWVGRYQKISNSI